MICPSCGTHYEPPATECPQCGRGLAVPPDPDIQLVAVFRTGDAGLIPLVKSLLDSEGIEYLVRGEAVQDLFGSGRVGSGYNIVTGPAEFVVREPDAGRARELLRELAASAPSDDSPGAE